MRTLEYINDAAQNRAATRARTTGLVTAKNFCPWVEYDDVVHVCHTVASKSANRLYFVLENLGENVKEP